MTTVHTVSGNMDGEVAGDNKRSTFSGRGKCLNLSFVKTPLGILQLVVTVINVICIGIMGDLITMLSFMCLIITTLIVITSITSNATASFLPKTTFFIAYHILATVFYVCSSIAVISEASKYSEMHWRSGSIVTFHEAHNLRGQVLAAGSFGIFATVVYAALTILSFYHFLRS